MTRCFSKYQLIGQLLEEEDVTAGAHARVNIIGHVTVGVADELGILHPSFLVAEHVRLSG
jgi:hypothetical protein